MIGTCKNCGNAYETTDEGYTCPICGYFRNYPRPRQVRA